nr:hypothetical protein [Mycoplasmopsis bovis]
MAKQLSVNEWKYLFEKYEKYRSGELTKKCFLNEMMKIKNVKHISDDQWKRLVNKYKRYNLGMNIESWVEDRLKKVKVPAAKKDKIKWWNIRWIFKWF